MRGGWSRVLGLGLGHRAGEAPEVERKGKWIWLAQPGGDTYSYDPRSQEVTEAQQEDSKHLLS